MINVPVSTHEKPLTVIDYIAHLQQCITVAEVLDFGDRLPRHIAVDERYVRASAARLGAIAEKKAAA